MLREIVLDTETTGLNPKAGDRLIEVGCVELIDRRPTGVEFHRFVNPEGRDVHPDAEAIHGIGNAQLVNEPVFSGVVDDFLAFIGDDPLVIHNAPFDVGFLNMELQRLKRPILDNARVVDTLALAKRKHPAGPNSLDGLCKRYGVDNSDRTKHGAIIDSLLLAEVYVELLGIRQAALVLGAGADQSTPGSSSAQKAARQRPKPLKSPLTAEDEAKHLAFVKTLGDDVLWLKS
ncbi:MAG: DNA polymerase III subunit epsilon [Pseudomonadota bacterium]